jgi:hypothetical protein
VGILGSAPVAIHVFKEYLNPPLLLELEYFGLSQSATMQNPMDDPEFGAPTNRLIDVKMRDDESQANPDGQ